MRVPFEAIEHEEYTDARYEDRPFTGTAFYVCNGVLAEECDFVEGYLHGMRREYYASGRLMWEAAYRDGVPDGRSAHYFEDGRIEAMFMYEAGQTLERLEFSCEGVKVAEYRREPGILREWREDGSLRKETTFASPDGYDRGSVVEERYFDHDGKPTVVQRNGGWRIAGSGRDA
ncbi:hypothetical protein AB1L88_14140 [Tautonia sp. JC769]|uniref:toxin-antitoxin system YwqK family antitoxin n=1 Tax=Tautonia sp. JC769 TaxID=3232135 RepID=UPI003457EA65